MPSDAHRIVARLKETRPHAAEMAVLVSLAVRVEPELLRSMRLRLLPPAPVSAEADLWFSDVIISRSSLFAVMSLDVADLLRLELARDAERLQRAWTVVETVHRGAPPAVRAEEEITWRTLVDPHDPRIGDLFETVLSGLRQGRYGLARWAARALPRLPLSAQRRAEAWQVAIQAGGALGGQVILRHDGPEGGLRALGPRLTNRKAPKMAIGVRLFESAMRLSEPPESTATRVTVPKLNPIVVEVSWEEERKRLRQIVSLRQGTTQDIELRSDKGLRLLTSELVEYGIRPVAARAPEQALWVSVAKADGLTACVYRGDRLAMLAFDLDRARTKGLAGFAITRIDPRGERIVLANRMTFSGGDEPAPSTNAPIQRFHWFDEPATLLTGPYKYEITALYGNAQKLTTGASVSVSLDLLIPSTGFDAGFTRPRAPERRDGSRTVLRPETADLLFDTAPYEADYARNGGHARALLHQFLQRAAAKSSRVEVLAHELDEPDVIRAFQALGKALRIVLLAGSSRGRMSEDEAAKLLRKAGCTVISSASRRLANASFAVRYEGADPVEVLTGSAGLSLATLYERQSHFILVQEPAVLAMYERQFAELLQPSRRVLRRPAPVSIELAAGMLEVAGAPAFPASDEAARIAELAASSVLFALHKVGGPQLLDVLTRVPASSERAAPRHATMTAGIEAGDGRDILHWAEHPVIVGRVSSARRSPSPLLRFNLVAVDFNRPGATAIVSSSTFSPASQRARGNSFLTFRGPALVAPFAVETLRIVDDYLYHARLKALEPSGRKLDGAGRWWRRYYSPSHPAAGRRLVLSTPDMNPAPRSAAAWPHGSLRPRLRA